MFDYLRFRWKLGQLERELRQNEKHYETKLKTAKQRKASADELHLIQDEGAGEYFHFRDEIRKLHSRYLHTQASRLLIPRPSLNDETMWEHEGPFVYLTEHGINHLRATIRAERKARVELFLMWVPGVVGILGALIGLVAILFGKS
ncbi:MAG: hypothetical protein WA858_05240 [Xanthobacteraceae bacterium]|jgi:hypothetical protein